MALSGPWPALVLAVVSILGAVLMGIAHRGRNTGDADVPTEAVAPTEDVAPYDAVIDDAATAQDPLPEPVALPAHPVPAQAEPVSTVPPQAPPPPAEQLRVVRDILPGR